MQKLRAQVYSTSILNRGRQSLYRFSLQFLYKTAATMATR